MIAGASITAPFKSASFRPFLAETRKGQHIFCQINDHLLPHHAHKKTPGADAPGVAVCN
jgi:hypothetical protein